MLLLVPQMVRLQLDRKVVALAPRRKAVLYPDVAHVKYHRPVRLFWPEEQPGHVIPVPCRIRYQTNFSCPITTPQAIEPFLDPYRCLRSREAFGIVKAEQRQHMLFNEIGWMAPAVGDFDVELGITIGRDKTDRKQIRIRLKRRKFGVVENGNGAHSEKSQSCTW